MSKTTAAVGVLGKEAVPVNDTCPSARYLTSCFPARYSRRRQGRQKHLSWDATVPFKYSKGQNFLCVFLSLLPFNIDCSFLSHIGHANTLASKCLLYSHVFIPSLWPQNFRLLVVETTCVSDCDCLISSSSCGGEFSETSGLLVLVGFTKMMYGLCVCRRVYTYVLIYVCFRRGPPVQNHPKLLTSKNQHVIDGFPQGLEGLGSGGPWQWGWTHAAGFYITTSVCLKGKPTNLRQALALSKLLYKPMPSRDNCAQMSWKHDRDIYLFTSSLYLDSRDFLASHNHISI